MNRASGLCQGRDRAGHAPRDRKGEFEPRLIEKHQTRFTGFDEKVLSLYARGMTTREIQGHLEEGYRTEVSPSSRCGTRAGWRTAPCLWLGITLEGQKEVLGLWTGAGEGSRFWLGVLTELRNRGVKDIYVACVDGLRGFPQAVETIFPKAQVQLFEKKWTKYPAIGKLWRERWEHMIPFFAMPAELRKVVYTTNAVESLHRQLHKAIETRGAFPAKRRRSSCCIWQSSKPLGSGIRCRTGNRP